MLFNFRKSNLLCIQIDRHIANAGRGKLRANGEPRQRIDGDLTRLATAGRFLGADIGDEILFQQFFEVLRHGRHADFQVLLNIAFGFGRFLSVKISINTVSVDTAYFGGRQLIRCLQTQHHLLQICLP